jgi:hypothetical protein
VTDVPAVRYLKRRGKAIEKRRGGVEHVEHVEHSVALEPVCDGEDCPPDDVIVDEVLGPDLRPNDLIRRELAAKWRDVGFKPLGIACGGAGPALSERACDCLYQLFSPANPAVGHNPTVASSKVSLI